MRFMLLQNYAATEVVSEPMSSWAPGDVKAHIEFQRSLNVAQALAGPDLVKIARAAPQSGSSGTDRPGSRPRSTALVMASDPKR